MAPETMRLFVRSVRAMRATRSTTLHLDEEAARSTFFGGLAASGWHTAALTMRLLVESDMRPAGGIIGARGEELTCRAPSGRETSSK